MSEIRDRESLEALLKRRLPVDAVLMAARAALRVLPLIQRALENHAELHRIAIVLPAFRALTVANFVGTWPWRIGEASDAASRAAEFTAIGDFGAEIANIAGRAASAAAHFTRSRSERATGAAVDVIARAADAANRFRRIFL